MIALIEYNLAKMRLESFNINVLFCEEFNFFHNLLFSFVVYFDLYLDLIFNFLLRHLFSLPSYDHVHDILCVHLHAKLFFDNKVFPYHICVRSDYMQNYINLLYLILHLLLVVPNYIIQNMPNIVFSHIFYFRFLSNFILHVLLSVFPTIFHNTNFHLYIISNVHVLFLFLYNLTYISHFQHYLQF